MISDEEADISKSELEEDVSEVYVWPLMVIVANVPFRSKYGAIELRNELIKKGFNPVKVHPLWDCKGSLRYAIVEFTYDFLGFTDALRFEKSYASNCQGKSNFVSDGEKGNKMYYWVAMEDDYNSEDVIGNFLRDHGDLKTLKQYEELDRMRNSCYISSLTDEIKLQNSLIKEIETKYKETSILQFNSMNDKDEMLRYFNKEKQKIEEDERCRLAKIYEDHERLKVELERERDKLEKREKELENREANNEQERLTLLYEQQQIEKAILEQKAYEKLPQLADKYKMEKRELLRKVTELEQQLDGKEVLIREAERLRLYLQGLKEEDLKENLHAKKDDALQQEINFIEEKIAFFEKISQDEIEEERKISDELQYACNDLKNQMIITKHNAIYQKGMKRLREPKLDSKAFVAAAKRRYLDEKAVELCSLWADYLRDPSWFPFEVVADNGDGEKIMIDEEDEKVMKLRDECGEEGYKAVITELIKLNNTEDLTATLNEGISYIVNECWSSKKRRLDFQTQCDPTD